MSEGEVFVLVASSIVAALGWLAWLVRLTRTRPLERAHRARAPLQWAFVASPLLLLAVLLTVSSHDVRSSVPYVAFYLAVGAAWVWAAQALVPLAGGVSIRDDVVERGNEAAGLVAAAALVGLTLCFAGGNVGDGPGWWVVLACAVLSTGAFHLLWWLAQRATRSADAITIDRDRGTAVRTALFLLALGLVLGRAVAGDWVSAGATLRDFAANGWPAAAFAAVECFVGRGSSPTAEAPATPVTRDGLVPGLAYVGLALAWLVVRGPW